MEIKTEDWDFVFLPLRRHLDTARKCAQKGWAESMVFGNVVRKIEQDLGMYQGLLKEALLVKFTEEEVMLFRKKIRWGIRLLECKVDDEGVINNCGFDLDWKRVGISGLRQIKDKVIEAWRRAELEYNATRGDLSMTLMMPIIKGIELILVRKCTKSEETIGSMVLLEWYVRQFNSTDDK